MGTSEIYQKILDLNTINLAQMLKFNLKFDNKLCILDTKGLQGGVGKERDHHSNRSFQNNSKIQTHNSQFNPIPIERIHQKSQSFMQQIKDAVCNNNRYNNINQELNFKNS